MAHRFVDLFTARSGKGLGRTDSGIDSPGFLYSDWRTGSVEENLWA